MRKWLALLLAVAFLGFLSFSANAAIKPGSTCKKLGQISFATDKKYTCIKSGNKLIWKMIMMNKVSKPTISIKEPLPLKPQSPILYRVQSQDSAMLDGIGTQFITEIPPYPNLPGVVLQAQMFTIPTTQGFPQAICRYDSFQGEGLKFGLWIIPRTPIKIYCTAYIDATEVRFRTYALRHYGKLSEIGYCGSDCYEFAPITNSEWVTLKFKD